LLLLSARYAIDNNPDEKLYNNNYGIPISSSTALSLFFERFNNVTSPWYYKLDVSPITTFYALTDANTMGKSSDEKDINNKFKMLLKDGLSAYRGPFTNYFLVSIYTIFKVISQADFWGTYPTSSGGSSPDLEHFLIKARQSFGKRTSPEILIRHTSTFKRHEKFAGKINERKADGCNSQFQTMRVNPHFRKDNKPRGKTVCIIDDFNTYGSSCETARYLLESLGVAKLVFITMGKFGKIYCKYDYTIAGDVFGSYTFQQKGYSELTGAINTRSNIGFLESIKGLV
jgi:hypothetical protein